MPSECKSPLEDQVFLCGNVPVVEEQLARRAVDCCTLIVTRGPGAMKHLHPLLHKNKILVCFFTRVTRLAALMPVFT